MSNNTPLSIFTEQGVVILKVLCFSKNGIQEHSNSWEYELILLFDCEHAGS